MAGCGDTARLPVAAGAGPQPEPPTPRTGGVPTANIAKALGWPAGKVPLAAPWTWLQAFAADLDHMRWWLVPPNGDSLVTETNIPKEPGDAARLHDGAM